MVTPSAQEFAQTTSRPIATLATPNIRDIKVLLDGDLERVEGFRRKDERPRITVAIRKLADVCDCTRIAKRTNTHRQPCGLFVVASGVQHGLAGAVQLPGSARGFDGGFWCSTCGPLRYVTDSMQNEARRDGAMDHAPEGGRDDRITVERRIFARKENGGLGRLSEGKLPLCCRGLRSIPCHLELIGRSISRARRARE